MKYIILCLFLLGGCSMHHIQTNEKDMLAISLNSKNIVKGNGCVIYEKNVRISHINIYQKIFKMNNGTVLTYEDAIVDIGYILNHGMKRIISSIFSSYQYDIIDYKDNIYFVKLHTKNKQLYLIIENLNKKRLKIVYGFSEQMFHYIQFKVIHNKPIVKNNSNSSKSITAATSITNPAIYISSTWSEKNIILDTLVRKAAGCHIRHK